MHGFWFGYSGEGLTYDSQSGHMGGTCLSTRDLQTALKDKYFYKEFKRIQYYAATWHAIGKVRPALSN
jgi:hypothetical protein